MVILKDFHSLLLHKIRKSDCLEQCFPIGAPWSPFAPRCIAKGSAGDDITNK